MVWPTYITTNKLPAKHNREPTPEKTSMAPKTNKRTKKWYIKKNPNKNPKFGFFQFLNMFKKQNI